ncbi:MULTISPECIES: carboxypeptidase M32 [unclassified Aureispira]|uniref:carboxypeptidase M32 n=1 Tax=unclassified Aureispira TaxID=2649989 RepID=UPI000698A142|nr:MULTISPECIES: carboxypeptidase M32 [unclassified Aureispira]WMX16898.1 carboxypeptidase M32 [Aureispira sp. CCB-E]
MSIIRKQYEQYVAHLQKIQDLNSTLALLHWDNEVNAPPKGAQIRGQQIATLSATVHEWATSPEFGGLLVNLNDNRQALSENEAKNVELSLALYNKEKNLSTEFVTAFSKARTNAFQAWLKARKAKDYSLYKNELSVMIELLKEKAELIGYDEHPYDALIDEFEKGATVAQLDVLFGDVRQQLVAFAKEIQAKGKPSEKSFLNRHYDKQKQWDFGIELLTQMGYDFEAGRQDISEHPFTTTFSSKDVRVTTRIEEDNPIEMIGGCVHEGGHALYEMGLPAKYYGLPLGMPTSLGIHESQSRLWENQVGLSLAYWKANFPRMQELFPASLGDITIEQFYKAINQLEPNYLRTIADEIHYHLHVLIRYEIEKGLIEGTYDVDSLETVWNQKYKDFLGLDVPHPTYGILQDVHWAEGLFGYFPTYSLGSFYAAQFYSKAKEDIPNLEAEIAQGNMKPLLEWLRYHIHQHGQKYTSEELCQRITGEGLNLSYFMNYAREKYAIIYDFDAKVLSEI